MLDKIRHFLRRYSIRDPRTVVRGSMIHIEVHGTPGHGVSEIVSMGAAAQEAARAAEIMRATSTRMRWIERTDALDGMQRPRDEAIRHAEQKEVEHCKQNRPALVEDPGGRSVRVVNE